MTPAPNIVLLVVDTLRADHLGAYGYRRPTSPNLDAFAASGVLFEQARSQASCTFPSVNSLLTSRYPIHFLRQPERFMGIPEGVDSLAEILHRRGYSTLAITASPIVRATASKFNPDGGFGRGFDTFEEGCAWRDAGCLLRRLSRHLPGLESPYFLYLHYMEPHGPYRPPRRHRFRFVRPYEGEEHIALGDPNPIARRLEKGEKAGVSARDVEHLVDLYDEEIAYFDDRLPSLLRRLRELGPGGETIFVVTADHGEEFLEHGAVKHCMAPFDTQVKVPLILRFPGGPQGLRVRSPVGLVDVLPTLLDYLDGAAPEGFAGRSLRPLIDGREPPAGAAAAFSSQGPWRAAADGRMKLLFQMAEKRFSLFDLAVDPGETEDVLAGRPEDFHRLRRALYEWLQQTEGEVASRNSLAAAAEVEERLRALGYL